MRVRAGLTMIEVLIVVVVVIVLAVGAMVAMMLPALGAARASARQLKDSTQVRGIHQGLVMWAQNNRDVYPLPSVLDVKNWTLEEEGAAKDTTANIYSILVAHGLITTELLVSPAEVNPNIGVYERYQYDSPRGAVRPREAHWDPGLSADFTGVGGGHISYAHLLPAEERLDRWGNTFVATEAMLGMRGPEITGVTLTESGTVSPRLANPRTLTFRIHRPTTGWQGNIAFNDNHVEHLTMLSAGMYVNSAGEKRPDLLHYDEPDDATGMNNYLGIFVTAGEGRGDFRGIWD